jgi:hypothetical protein
LTGLVVARAVGEHRPRMKTSELLRHRLRNQHLSEPRFRQPHHVVRHLVAMQAQEYSMAKWAIGLRMARPALDAEVEHAFDAGKILRTHVLRPTWHFVAPADIRWLLALTAPRVHAASAFMYRKLELSAAEFRRGDGVLVRVLRDGEFLTRTALQAALARAGIKASGPRLAYLVMHAELEGLICSGPRVGRQFTYALLDNRVPPARALSREAALQELSRRYFATRGPATAYDFANWSGLTLADARDGIESLGPGFAREAIDGREHVFRPAKVAASSACLSFLMPDYDEYGMSYRDRSALLPAPADIRTSRAHALAYNRMIVVDGKIAGSWRRSLAGKSVSIETDYPVPLGRRQLRAVATAVRRFKDFAGRTRD